MSFNNICMCHYLNLNHIQMYFSDVKDIHVVSLPTRHMYACLDMHWMHDTYSFTQNKSSTSCSIPLDTQIQVGNYKHVKVTERFA